MRRPCRGGNARHHAVSGEPSSDILNEGLLVAVSSLAAQVWAGPTCIECEATRLADRCTLPQRSVLGIVGYAPNGGVRGGKCAQPCSLPEPVTATRSDALSVPPRPSLT